MGSATEPDTNLVIAPMRAALLVVVVVIGSLAVSLFALTEHTDRYFAWTIGAPITASFIGAGYLTGTVFTIMSFRERTWAHARLAIPVVLVVSVFTTIGIFLHLDAFHFDAPSFITRAGTWVFVVGYIVLPLALIAAWFMQIRRPGHDPPRTQPLPPALRRLMTAQAGVMLVVGLVMFSRPEATDAWWPWTLTPLTGRTVAAWACGVATLVIHALWENDLRRVRAMMHAYWLWAVLQFVTIGRYPNAVQWDSISTWLYIAFMATILVAGVGGRFAEHRPRTRST